MPQCPYFSDESQGAPCPSGGSAPGCRANCPVPPKPTEAPAVGPAELVKTGGYVAPPPVLRPTCPFTRLVCPVPEPPPSSGHWAKCDAMCLTASEQLMASQWPPTIKLTPYIDRPAAGTAGALTGGCTTGATAAAVGMKILATVRLGPVVYEVKQVPHLFNKDDHTTVLGGFIDHAHLLIEVATAYGPAHAGVSFLHELVHAVEHFFSLDLEERETDCLARGLYMALADNGLLAPQGDANAPPV